MIAVADVMQTSALASPSGIVIQLLAWLVIVPRVLSFPRAPQAGILICKKERGEKRTCLYSALIVNLSFFSTNI